MSDTINLIMWLVLTIAAGFGVFVIGVALQKVIRSDWQEKRDE